MSENTPTDNHLTPQQLAEIGRRQSRRAPTVDSVDSLAERCFALACDEVEEIFNGPQHIGLEDLTACEMVALLTVIRPVFERRRAAQRQQAPVLALVPR